MNQQAPDADTLSGTGRPAQVTVGAAVLIAFGAFISLVGLALAVLGGLFLDLDNLPTWVDPPTAEFRALSILVAGAALAFGIVQVVAGVQIMRGRSWAQVIGIVLALVGALVAGLGLLQGFGASATGVTTIFLPIVVAYLYAAWGFATAPGWFVRT
ncbi:MAG TPA: hypothetical protein VGB34_04570 [Candidatus Limnocylindria bacterium]|jgi:hypothetical protein